ncbi:MAG TPA: rod shape-determining protein MreD [Candidatus Dormibacteraeota bacterium]|nr:rod shape-determining protein MreD [Candidatus Dormibacteraeota bacterium]
MKRLGIAALMLATVLIQVTWAPRVTVAGVFPNLALVAVIAVTWTAGVRAGMLWACIAGLMLDLTAPGPLGPHALALLAGAYLTGFWWRNLERDSVLHPVLAVAVSTALYSLILIASDDTLGLPVPPLGVALQLVVASCVYNAALMPFVLVVVRKLHAPLTKRIEAA